MSTFVVSRRGALTQTPLSVSHLCSTLRGISCASISALSILCTTLLLPVYTNATITVVASDLIQCHPVFINWSGGIAPYAVTILSPLGSSQEIVNISENWLDWFVDMQAGSIVTVSVTDMDDGGTAQFTIQDGSDSSCLGTAITGGNTGTRRHLA